MGLQAVIQEISNTLGGPTYLVAIVGFGGPLAVYATFRSFKQLVKYLNDTGIKIKWWRNDDDDFGSFGDN